MSKVKMEKLLGSHMAEEALRVTTNLIDKYKERPSGSDATLAVAKELANTLKNYSDKTEIEYFPFYPKAFYASVKIVALTYIVALIFMWLSIPFIPSILLITSLVVSGSQFVLYKEVINRLFPLEEGANVYAVIESSEKSYQTVIFSSHHDSSPIVNSDEKEKQNRIIAFVSYVALIALSLFQSFNLSKKWIIYPLLIVATVALYWVVKLFKYHLKEHSSGAGDNLISSAMGLEIAKYFNEKRLKHTKVIVASFDGEEVGLAGSRYFYKTNRDLFSGTVYNFNVDSIYNAKDLSFLTSDINGTLKLSQQIATSCVEVAKSMGYETFSQPIPFLGGATDASVAAKEGYEATTLIGFDYDDKNVPLHTKEDLPKRIEKEAVKRVLSIAIRFIERVDNNLI
ncbi:MAG: M28 family metallopeptidase [Sphaerochaetaceae bacterium]